MKIPLSDVVFLSELVAISSSSRWLFGNAWLRNTFSWCYAIGFSYGLLLPFRSWHPLCRVAVGHYIHALHQLDMLASIFCTT